MLSSNQTKIACFTIKITEINVIPNINSKYMTSVPVNANVQSGFCSGTEYYSCVSLI